MKYAGIEVTKVTTINQPVRVAIFLVSIDDDPSGPDSELHRRTCSTSDLAGGEMGVSTVASHPIWATVAPSRSQRPGRRSLSVVLWEGSGVSCGFCGFFADPAPCLGTPSWPHNYAGCAGSATASEGFSSPPSLALGQAQQDQRDRQHDREQKGKRSEGSWVFRPT